MKHLIRRSLPLPIVLLAACGGAAEVEPEEEVAEISLEERQFGIEAGTLEYTESGPGLPTAEKTLYFADWGLRNAEYLEITTPEGEVQRGLKMRLGDEGYTANFDTRRGTRGPIKPADARTGGPEAAYHEMVLANGGTLEGTEDVLGLECRVYVSPAAGLPGATVRTYVHQALLMKNVVTDAEGKKLYEMIPSRFEAGAPPQDKLLPPKDIVFTSADQVYAAMNQLAEQANAEAAAKDAESGEGEAGDGE